MRSASAFVPDELINCIADGRDPTVGELFGVAERIWTEMRGRHSVLGWSHLPADSAERVLSLRAAHVALLGAD